MTKLVIMAGCFLSGVAVGAGSLGGGALVLGLTLLADRFVEKSKDKDSY